MNPHNSMVALDPPSDTKPRRWRCRYCGDEGTMDELDQRACKYVYPPCETCGLTPTCAPDCLGVAAALGALRGDVQA